MEGDWLMAWLQLDDQFHRHRKVVTLSDRAWRLHVTAMLECCAQLSDGYVEKKLVPTWPNIPKGRALKPTIDELVDAGLWEPESDGWLVHDYLEYNPNRATILAKRKAACERMQRARLKSVRANTPRTCGVTNGERSANSRARGSPAPSSKKKIPPTPQGGHADETHRGPHKTVTDCYFKAFEAARKSKPVFGKREGKAVQTLLDKLGGDTDRACRCIRNAYGTPWWMHKATICSIANDPDRHTNAESETADAASEPEQQGIKLYDPEASS